MAQGSIGRLLTVLGVVAACLVGAVPAATATPSAPVPGQVLPPTPAELGADINVAVSATDGYWRRHWSEFFTGTYTSPRVVGLYDSAVGGGPTCGGQPALPNNAFYCNTGQDFLAWDAQLMIKGVQYGDSWVYLVVAHEWGHAVQARLAAPLRFAASELQADCLAGAAITGAARDGTLRFEPGDTDELATGLRVVADKTPWTSSRDHGNAEERIRNFAWGQRKGVRGCLPR